MAISREDVNILEIMRLVKTNVNANLNCHNIGRILEFDPSTQTCTVELMQVKQYMDNYYNPAPITDVPLIIYGAGGGHITLPDPVGTYCLLFFMDRNIDSFLETGEQYVPETTRMHDFTDCIAITTFKTLVNPITDYDDKAVSILHEDIINEIKYSSFIKVYADKIQLKRIQTSEDEQQAAEITLDDKILIKNNSQDLMGLISSLIKEIKDLKTTDGKAMSAANIQNLTNIESNFKSLLAAAESEDNNV